MNYFDSANDWHNYTNRISNSLTSDWVDDLLVESKWIPIKELYKMYILTQDDDYIKLQIAVPGLTKNEIKLQTKSDNVISISSTIEKSEGLIQKFNKEYKIDSNYDLSTISAKLEKGLLNITIESGVKSQDVPIK